MNNGSKVIKMIRRNLRFWLSDTLLGWALKIAPHGSPEEDALQEFIAGPYAGALRHNHNSYTKTGAA